MSDPQPKPSEAYHHGDLREALIAAAREALETQPPETITLKALAARLGVSQPAPYRHFASREALMQAVAADGFRRFRAALTAASVGRWEEGGLQSTLMAYVRFGQANRGVYRLMFASRTVHTVTADSPLAQASAAAFELLLSSVGPRAPPGRRQAVAVWVWSTLHGIVMLDAEGLVAGPPGAPLTVDAVVRELAEAMQARL